LVKADGAMDVCVRSRFKKAGPAGAPGIRLAAGEVREGVDAEQFFFGLSRRSEIHQTDCAALPDRPVSLVVVERIDPRGAGFPIVRLEHRCRELWRPHPVPIRKRQRRFVDRRL
jgi:hypothetical protein